jgi:rhamnosyltransferase
MNPSDVLTLMVTHQGADSIRHTLQAWADGSRQSGLPLLVIDNASTDETVPVVESVGPANLELLKMPRNVGVSRAFNVGMERALERGLEWLFILDQDSLCAPGCLDLLRKTADDLERQGEKVGAVCPTVRSRVLPEVLHYPYRWTGHRFEMVADARDDSSVNPIPIDSTVSSGTLYLVDALVSVGGFREPYFIDFVDHECHLRLRRAGWSLWWERKAELFHGLGRRQMMTDEGVWVEHDPIRYYYMARNMTEGYWRLGGVRAVLHLGAEIRKQVRRLRRHGERPAESISFILRGVKDAFLGKSGPLDPGH